jgi:hypothetical protein
MKTDPFRLTFWRAHLRVEHARVFILEGWLYRTRQPGPGVPQPPPKSLFLVCLQPLMF